MLQIAVQIVLARLLPVEAFGLLAIASMVVNLGSRIAEIGTGPALIQRPVITPTHIRVAWSLSVVGGALASTAIWFGAPLAASIFRADAVTPVLRLIGLVFLFGGIGTTAEALLQRRMDYRRLLRVELVSYGFGYAIVGVGLAIRYHNVWALAWATVTQSVVKSAMLLIMAPHPTRPSAARSETTDLLNFGIGMTLGRLASFAAQNADYFVVARSLGGAALGYYARAYQLMCMPIYQFSSILNTVLFSAYSSIQTDAERLRRGYLGSLCLSAIVVFPALTAMAIVAVELMTGVFGAQWQPAAVPLQILCAAGAFYCICNLADSLVRALGVVYVKFLYNTGYAAAVLAGAFIGARWDITGVAVGVLAATAMMYVLMGRLTVRLTDSSWRAFFAAQRPAVVVSAAVALVGVPATLALRSAQLAPLLVLGGSLAASGSAAVAAVFMIPRLWLSETVRDVLERARKHGLDSVFVILRLRSDAA